MDSVAEEAQDNLKRLRHHASLAMLCGNNEDYLQIKMWGESMSHRCGLSDVTGSPDVKGGLPAVAIYEKLLPKLVGRLTLTLCVFKPLIGQRLDLAPHPLRLRITLWRGE